MKKTLFEKLLGYQTRLQDVANDLATKLRELLDEADDETLAMLRREYKTATGDVKSRIRAIQKLVVALEKARSAKFADAEKLVAEIARTRRWRKLLRSLARRNGSTRNARSAAPPKSKSVVDG